MHKPSVNDDVAEFIEQGSMRKDASMSSQTQARTIMLAALANVLSNPDQKTLEDYDAEDGPDPASYAKTMRMPDAEGWQGVIDREINSLREKDVFKLVRRSQGLGGGPCQEERRQDHLRHVKGSILPSAATSSTTPSTLYHSVTS